MNFVTQVVIAGIAYRAGNTHASEVHINNKADGEIQIPYDVLRTVLMGKYGKDHDVMRHITEIEKHLYELSQITDLDGVKLNTPGTIGDSAKTLLIALDAYHKSWEYEIKVRYA